MFSGILGLTVIWIVYDQKGRKIVMLVKVEVYSYMLPSVAIHVDRNCVRCISSGGCFKLLNYACANLVS